ncbi:MAG: substrate-binding domain-containing protein [Bacteroidota bacterium]
MAFSSCGDSGGGSKKGTQVSGTVTISGAFALYPMAVRWAEEFQKEYPDIRIDISAGGAGKGMMDVLSGMIDLGMVSRAVNPEEIKNGAFPIKVARDVVLITINARNPKIKELKAKGISKSMLQEMFLSNSMHKWGIINGTFNGDPVHVFTRSDACGAAEVIGKYLGASQEALTGVGVFGDPGMADAIKNDPLAIGFNNVTYVYDMGTRKKYRGLEVLPLDINENKIIDPDEQFYDNVDLLSDAVRTGKYPAPPARDLFFVTKGKPTNESVKLFLNWVLTKGQQMLKEAGYVELHPDQLDQVISKLK